MAGSQDFADDPRNAAARIYLNDALVAREDAQVSVLDAGFVLGDGVGKACASITDAFFSSSRISTGSMARARHRAQHWHEPRGIDRRHPAYA